MISALFSVQAVHTTSVTHSQFDKHLIMPRISRRHPLSVAVMHSKKITAFCSQCPLCPSPWALCSPNHLSLTRLSITWPGLSHRLQVETDTSGTQLSASLYNFEVHIEDIGRTVPIYFSSANKMSRPNKQQMHLPMSIYYPPYYKSQPILFCARNKYSKHSLGH